MNKKQAKRKTGLTRRTRLLPISLFALAFGVIGVIVLRASFADSPARLNIHYSGGPIEEMMPQGEYLASPHDIGACYGYHQGWQYNLYSGSSSSGTIGCVSGVSNDIGAGYGQTYFQVHSSISGGRVFQGFTGCDSTSGTQCYIYIPNGGTRDVYISYAVPTCPAGQIGTPPNCTNPPAPVVTVGVNPSSVAYGGSTTVTWSTTNSPTSCSNNFGGTASGSGSFAAKNLTASRSFTVTCSNAGGTASGTKSVNVAAQIITPPPSGGGGTGGGGTGGTTTPKPKPTGTTTQPADTSDKTPPSIPTNFQAEVQEDRPVVSLSWDASTDNVAVQSYKLERSTDQQNWQELVSGNGDTSYTDTDTSFQTHYFYRLQAFDSASNASGYAVIDVMTLAFKANITKDVGGDITSEDGQAKVTFPAGVLSEDATCSIEDSHDLPPPVKGYVTAHGPYQVVCKTASGSTPDFTGPLTASVSISTQDKKQYAGFRVYLGNNGDWKQGGTDPSNITLDNANQFVVYGKHKTTPIWVKIIIILLVLAAIVGLVLGFLYWRYRQKQKDEYDDYYRKMNGY